MSLKHFSDISDVIDYVFRELSATLTDDANECEQANDNEMADELRAKMHDIELAELAIAEIAGQVQEWKRQRRALSALEESRNATPDDWQSSDDDASRICSEIADKLSGVDA